MGIRWVGLALDHGPEDSTQRFALVALGEYADQETGICYPSVGSIARRIGTSERHARRLLRALEADGWITCLVSSGRHSSTYQVNPIRFGTVTQPGPGELGSASQPGHPGPGSEIPNPDTQVRVNPDIRSTNPDTQVRQPGHPCPPNHQEPSGEPSSSLALESNPDTQVRVGPTWRQPPVMVVLRSPDDDEKRRPTSTRTGAAAPGSEDMKRLALDDRVPIVLETIKAAHHPRRVALPPTPGLERRIVAAIDAGWTATALGKYLADNLDLDRLARPVIAVVTWLLDNLPEPTEVETPRPPRPPWCGECDERTRLADEDHPRRCPNCHPATQQQRTPA